METAAESPADAAHREARANDLAPSFLEFVRRCPHVMQSIQAFVAENAAAFATLAVDDEHRLEFTDIHQRYLDLIEGHVNAFLQFYGASADDFLAALSCVQSIDAQEWKPFQALLDKTDYYNFAKMMQIQAVGVGPQGPSPES
mmetsp:Transcript_90994/g.257062  ORF Transcript_90994/g.257062 Transcript_90994/m.257062 type:complete len:143 (-) Transcript_90994:59-487(-)